VADIHFKPDAAMEAVKWVEVVRVNPGNYADSKKFAIKEYTDEQYAAELKRIEEKFAPLVIEAKKQRQLRALDRLHVQVVQRDDPGQVGDVAGEGAQVVVAPRYAHRDRQLGVVVLQHDLSRPEQLELQSAPDAGLVDVRQQRVHFGLAR